MIELTEPVNQSAIRLTYSRICPDADGATSFLDSTVGMSAGVYVPGIPLVDSSSPLPATMLTFSRLEPGYTSDWHPAPRRQFVLLLSGRIEVTVSDGEKRSFGPGSVVLVEDTIGAGHQTRALGSDECLFATVAFWAGHAAEHATLGVGIVASISIPFETPHALASLPVATTGRSQR